MPSWKTHLIFDLTFVIVFFGILFGFGLLKNIFLLISIALFNILATLFPDIDTPKSKIRIYTSLILAIIATVYLVVNFSIDSLISAVLSFIFIYLVIRFFPTNHRGITHKIWFSVIFSLVLTIGFWLMFRFSEFEFGIYFLIIFWGYLSHLILDKIT